MNEPERRQSDHLAIELRTKFGDFMERYDRDQEIGKEWRIDTTARLKIHCDFINKISPIYQRLCWLFAIITISTLGIAATTFWKHVFWK